MGPSARVSKFDNLAEFQEGIKYALEHGERLDSWVTDDTWGIVAVFITKEKLQDISNFGKVVVTADGKVTING